MAPLSGTRLVSAMCGEIYGITMFYLVKRTIHGHPRAATGESLLNALVLTSSPRRPAAGCGRQHPRRLPADALLLLTVAAHADLKIGTMLSITGAASFLGEPQKRLWKCTSKISTPAGRREKLLNDPRVRAAYLGV